MFSLFSKFGVWLAGGLVSLSGAWKTFLVVTFLAGLGVVLFNTFVDVLEAFLNWMADSLGDIAGFEGLNVGMGPASAYLAYKLMIPECLSTMVTAISLKFIWKFIPFVK